MSHAEKRGKAHKVKQNGKWAWRWRLIVLLVLVGIAISSVISDPNGISALQSGVKDHVLTTARNHLDYWIEVIVVIFLATLRVLSE